MSVFVVYLSFLHIGLCIFTVLCLFISLCLFAGQVMFPRHFMRVGFSIRGRIGWRAVENCPIVPTDLTFHRYWTISYNSTFTLLTEQHWWPCCNLDFLWFVCLHQTQNVTHSCKILLSLPLEKVKNNIAQGRCSISKTKLPSAFFGIFQPIALHWQRL